MLEPQHARAAVRALRARRRRVRRPPCSTACRGRRKRCRAAFSTTRAAASCSRGSPAAGVLSRRAPRRRSCDAHAAEMADGVRRWRRARRVRLRLEPQDRAPARRAAAARAPTCRSTSRESALERRQARLAARFPEPRRAARRRRLLAIRSPCRPISPADPRPASFPAPPSATSRPPRRGACCACSARVLSPGGRLIVGVDLKKDAAQAGAAYNDAAGVTAAFNLNLLARINRELGGYFDLDAFRHEAIYNPRDGRIEMHLVSRRDQDVQRRRPPLPLPRRRDHPHRELLQVHGAPVPGRGPRRRLDADPRVDRPGATSSASTSWT